MPDSYRGLDDMVQAHPHLAPLVTAARTAARTANDAFTEADLPNPVTIWWGSSLPDTSTRKLFHTHSTCEGITAKHVVSSRLTAIEVGTRRCHRCHGSSRSSSMGEHRVGEQTRQWRRLCDQLSAYVEQASANTALQDVFAMEHDLGALMGRESDTPLPLAGAVCEALRALRELITAAHDVKGAPESNGRQTAAVLEPDEPDVCLALEFVGDRAAPSPTTLSRELNPPAPPTPIPVLDVRAGRTFGIVRDLWKDLVQQIHAGTRTDDLLERTWPTSWLDDGPVTFAQLPPTVTLPAPTTTVTAAELTAAWRTNAEAAVTDLVNGWIQSLRETADRWRGLGFVTVSYADVLRLSRTANVERLCEAVLHRDSPVVIHDEQLSLVVSAAHAAWLDHLDPKTTLDVGAHGENTTEVIAALGELRGLGHDFTSALSAARAILADAA